MLAVQVRMPRFGGALRIIREARGLKPGAIEERAKKRGFTITGRTVFNIEASDDLPRLSSLEGLAAAYDVTLGALLVEIASVIEAQELQMTPLSDRALTVAKIYDSLSRDRQRLLFDSAQNWYEAGGQAEGQPTS